MLCCLIGFILYLHINVFDWKLDPTDIGVGDLKASLTRRLWTDHLHSNYYLTFNKLRIWVSHIYLFLNFGVSLYWIYNLIKLHLPFGWIRFQYFSVKNMYSKDIVILCCKKKKKKKRKKEKKKSHIKNTSKVQLRKIHKNRIEYKSGQ